MSIVLPRGKITTHLYTLLTTAQYPVGDAGPPEASHGWQGEPNATGVNFIPWSVISAGPATNSSGPLGAAQADWRATYFLSSAGVTRTQVERVADASRQILIDTERSTVEGWKVQQVRTLSLGPITRVSATSPAYFVQTDSVEIWLSKEL